MKRLFLLAAIISAFAIAGSGQIGVRQWKLVQLNGAGVGDSPAYLELDTDQSRFSGKAGCNRIFGQVSVRRDRVDFSNVGMTRMACADRRIQRLESEFVRALENVDGFERQGNSLTLYARRRIVMKLVALTKQNPRIPTGGVRLEDKKWTLEAISGVPVSKIGRGAFVVFDPDKKSVGGNSSCNVFGGTYSVSDSKVAITDVISTMRACIEDERMNVERQFLDGLARANRFEIHSDGLTLYQDRRLLLTFKGEAK